MTQILNTMFGKKKRLTALLVEIAIVTIIGWILIEPVAVDTTTALTPAGYDYDRLVMLEIGYLAPESDEYEMPEETVEVENPFDKLLLMIRARDGVEKATYTYNLSFEMNGRSTTKIVADSTLQDKLIKDLYFSLTGINFMPNTDFFSTFGIKDANGNNFQESEIDGKCFIISNSVAKSLFPDSSAIGKNLFPTSEWNPKSTIVGVTADVSYKKGDGRIGTCYNPVDINRHPHAITMRLGENVNPRAFIEKLTAELSDYRNGNYYLTHPVYMSDLRKDVFADKQRALTQKWVIVTFFLINVLLGVAGTFYVQCKTRIPDAGVMRAFGATKAKIIVGIVGEALFTAFVGWLIGSIIYLIYLSSQGFPMVSDASPVIQFMRPVWHDTKASRYSIIGGIILLMLLATAALGAWLPARKVARVNPVDALRDE